MRLRKLEILIHTIKEDFGATLGFGDGLNIVWADNSMGKSTCVNAIIYALGLEGMLSAKKNPPLKRVLQDKVEYDDGSSVPVTESETRLVIENSLGESIELRRVVKGVKDTKLVTVIFSDGRVKDYYVAVEGAATRENGFHFFLSNFLGIKLPTVINFEGRESPLYLECLLPFMIVNQMRGWSTITPQLPTQYGIRDVHRRSVEFLLNLDLYAKLQEKERIKQKEQLLVDSWHHHTKQLAKIASNISGRVSNLDIVRTPSATWEVSPSPSIELPTGDGSEWISLDKSIDALWAQLETLKQKELPTASEKYRECKAKYNELEEALKYSEILLSRLVSEMESIKSEAVQLKARQIDIKKDLKRNKDALRIRNYGGDNTGDDTHQCPVCSNIMADSMIDGSDITGIMGIEQNISYLEEQLNVYSKISDSTDRNVEEKINQINWLRTQVSEKRDSLKGLRETMLQDGRMPAKETVREIVTLENKLSNYKKVREEFFDTWCDFEDLAENWGLMLKEKESAKGDLLSDLDKKKLEHFESAFLSRVSQFNFNSSELSTLEINHTTLKPSYSDGFDIQNDVSASDLIRIIWSYLLAFLDVKKIYKNQVNHFGFLVLDEPGQQSIKKESFTSLIKKTSEIAKTTMQIIIFSSADPEIIHKAITGVDCNFHEIRGRVIKPKNMADSIFK